MPSLAVLFLAIMGAVFVVWAFLMFRMLWAINSRAKRERDPLAGVSQEFQGNLTAFFGYFRDPENRKDLLRLLAVTVLLIAIQFVGFFMLAQP